MKRRILLPGLEERIDVYSGDGEPFSVGLLEVGCKPRQKPAQLKKDRELFYKFWGDKYRMEVGWTPSFYLFLAHYSPRRASGLGRRIYGFDVEIRYLWILKSQLEGIEDREKQRLLFLVKKGKRRDELCEILKDCDEERLNDILSNCARNPQMSAFRGKIAEIIAQKDIEESLPEGSRIFRNGFLRYFNRHYRFGTEIDAIMFFYGKDKARELARSLKRRENVIVRDTFGPDE